ncbi:isocitrate lyase/PEP mutase family protein [Labrenzia aggregata]|uniref:Isocitrate lyase/PEP mutase family protein n=1 Tax=Roseibium aggregatum TaxID=187304 RepID=A0A939IYY4_9HYPH|nr:isocitrate lyase/PEP mutase family protein [Roseibium aggregatum]
MTPANRLRALLEGDRLLLTPSAGDALSARLIEQAGFPLAFISGFAVSASRIGMPDTGLISYAEMVDSARNIAAAVSMPVMADGDTGFGNALNVKRTVAGFAQAGAASVMIEDQVAPKRCGHTRGKMVVGREEAVDRIRAACDARDEMRASGKGDILILARTDARREHGVSEAIARAQAFREAGADILFVEEPQSEDEMRTICSEVDGPSMANLVEGGLTPILPGDQLEDLGFKIAIFPLTLMSAAMKAMIGALETMKGGAHPNDALLEFAELRKRVGFDEYYRQEQRYSGARD